MIIERQLLSLIKIGKKEQREYCSKNSVNDFDEIILPR